MLTVKIISDASLGINVNVKNSGKALYHDLQSHRRPSSSLLLLWTCRIVYKRRTNARHPIHPTLTANDTTTTATHTVIAAAGAPTFPHPSNPHKSDLIRQLVQCGLE